jgi:hypothetical protein
MSKARRKAGRMGGVKPQTPGNTERARPALPLWLPGLCAVHHVVAQVERRCRKTRCPISSLLWDKLDMEQWRGREHKARWNCVETFRDRAGRNVGKNIYFAPVPYLGSDEVPSRVDHRVNYQTIPTAGTNGGKTRGGNWLTTLRQGPFL